MALYHDATITPTKAELIAAWVPTQPWCVDPSAEISVIGAFRFDDPEGLVGMETHLITIGDTIAQVPLTYRDEPLPEADDAFIAEMQHSALGTRWVYDGLGDPRYRVMLAAVSLTGQGEALGMVEYGGKWFIAPTHVRITGGGWTQERVSVDDLTAVATEQADRTIFGNDQFEVTAFRLPSPGPQPALGLTATWSGHADPVVLATVRQR